MEVFGFQNQFNFGIHIFIAIVIDIAIEIVIFIAFSSFSYSKYNILRLQQANREPPLDKQYHHLRLVLALCLIRPTKPPYT